MTDQEKLNAANTIVLEQTGFATAAGLIPIPIADLVAVTAIHMDMIKQIAIVYEVDYSENTGKKLISAIGGTIIARIGSSAIKVIPGIGTLIGELTGAAVAAATTYALGKTFIWHFSNGGTFEDMDINKAKEIFNTEIIKGKKVAAEMEKEPLQNNQEKIFETIEKLSELNKKNIITDKDFEEQKQRLLNQL